jgi:hypothetical protein
MSKFNKEKEKKEAYEFPEYTVVDFMELEKELEKYRITKTLNNGEVISYCDDQMYLMDQGALSRTGAVVVTGFETKFNSKGEPYTFIDYPTKYAILQDKLEKFSYWKGRKEKTEKANKKSLDQQSAGLANEMKVDFGIDL